MARTYRRKVGAIKKSVYINIPSKISKEIGIAKGSVMYVTLEEAGRVILSKNQDEEAMKKPEPSLEPDGKPSNDTSGDGNLKHLLEEDYTW